MREIMTETVEQEVVPVVVKSPEDYINTLARNRLDLNPQKLGRALEADVIGSPEQLASTLDRVGGREVILDYLTPSGKRIKISSDREYPQESPLGKASNLLEAAARYKVLKTEESVPEQVRLTGWQLDRGIKDFKNEAERIVSGRTKRSIKGRVAQATAVLSMALVACSKANSGIPIPTSEVFPIEPTPEQVSEITLIAPNPLETPETSRLLSGVVLEEEEIQSELLSDQPFAVFYQYFQDQVRADPELHDENATFIFEAIRAQTSEGEKIFPLITVRADPDNPEGKTFTAMVIDLDGRGYTAVSLERSIVTGTDGVEYVVLSLAKDGYGNVLEIPIPIFALPTSEIGNPEAMLSFNPLGTEREDTIQIRLASLRGIESVITPEAPTNERRLSPDGHIYYNEAELYGGLFTINPENTSSFWDQNIRVLYKFNLYFRNTEFLNRYPNVESFIQAIEAREPIENMWLPVQYPSYTRRTRGYIASSEVGPIDLSAISVVIDRPTREEMLHHGPSDLPPYMFLLGTNDYEVYIAPVEIEGRQVLEFHFRTDIVYAEPPYRYPLLPEESPEQNLMVATEILNAWIWLIGHMPEIPPDGGYIRYYNDDVDPPALLPLSDMPTVPIERLRDIETSPIRLR